MNGTRMLSALKGRTNLFVGLLILVLISAAYLNSFVQDDAFISFRYAQNFVQQGELTWNPDEEERVEGYTNFLWTVMISLPIALGIDPVTASKFLGLLFAAGTLLVTYRLSSLIFQSTLPAVVTLVLLGTNYTFSAYATGGLETQLQTFLIVASTFLVFSIVERDRWALVPLMTLAFLGSAALLTRLDSALPVAVLLAFLLWKLLSNPLLRQRRLEIASYLVLPMFIIFGSYLLWKYSYYSALLPNSYYAKAAYWSREVLSRGLYYLFEFLRSYFLIPFLFLAVAFAKDIWSKQSLRVLFSISFLWCLYIVKVGGDFMEFRFIVPILPLIFVLITSVIFGMTGTRVKAALLAVLLVGSLHHALTFRFSYGIESISQLNQHIVGENENWRGVGRVLKELFSGSEEPPTIATTAAGAIPYYSELLTIDMQGINDRWIARNGVTAGSRPGHYRSATLDYLVRRNVNLVLGHPHVTPIAKAPRKTRYTVSDLRRFLIFDVKAYLVPATSKVVEIPLNSEYRITLLYLCQNRDVDKLIEDRKLNTYEIIRS